MFWQLALTINKRINCCHCFFSRWSKSSVNFDLWEAVKRVRSQYIREGTQRMKHSLMNEERTVCVSVTFFISWINTNCPVIYSRSGRRKWTDFKRFDKCFENVLLEAQLKSWFIPVKTYVVIRVNPCMARIKCTTAIIGLLSISLALLIFRSGSKKKEGENRRNMKRRNMEFVDLLEGHIH